MYRQGLEAGVQSLKPLESVNRKQHVPADGRARLGIAQHRRSLRRRKALQPVRARRQRPQDVGVLGRGGASQVSCHQAIDAQPRQYLAGALHVGSCVRRSRLVG